MTLIETTVAKLPHILLVDDDIELAELLAEYFRRHKFEVSLAHDGNAGLQMALENNPDLLLLDIMLPGLAGTEVLRELRKKSQLPVLMLTAMGDTTDRIIGLELGADDYMPKPANPRELCARINAILRRASSSPGNSEKIRIDDIELRPASRQVLCKGENITLTSTEFNLVHLLLQEAGRVVCKDELYRQVLGREAVAFDRAIDMHISNIRRKLGPASDGAERIDTIRGSGYQWLKNA
ncbi:MAG: response regulator transcription factor [Xanthomonadales bacterium]|nr:response regulator transcription factor [Xanthomonadales bacterium]